MKKLFLIISLVAFLGATTVPSYAAPKKNTTVNVDGEKCKICGKKDCDGKCTAKIDGKHQANCVCGDKNCDGSCDVKAKKAHSEKCGIKGKSSCCAKNAKKSSCEPKCSHSKKKAGKE